MPSEPFVPVTNAMEVTLQFAQQDGSLALNTFWVQNSVAWTQATMQSMLSAFITWFTTGDGTHAYQGVVADDAQLVEVTGRDMTTQNGFVVSTNAGLPISGTGGSVAAPLGLSWVITSRTGLAGRSYRGRTYLVCLATGFWSNIEQNEINATFAAHAVLAFEALITAVTANLATAKVVVCSRRHNGAPRETGVTTPITTYGYHNLLTDFQRRRAPAHNRHN